MLIDEGADINVKDNTGKTPLDIAGEIEIVDILRNQPDSNLSITNVEVGQQRGK